ncbi:MAG: hypothetical protein AAB320_07790 [Elusimicrobiota bacterium]
MSSALLLLALWAGAAAAQEDASQATPSILRMGGMALFNDTQGPLSFVTMTPKEVPEGARLLGTVTGRSCQRGLAIPLAASLRATTVSGTLGKGGYDSALADLRRRRPEVDGVYDVKVDLHLRSILGFYKSLCIEISARGFALPAPSTSP